MKWNTTITNESKITVTYHPVRDLLDSKHLSYETNKPKITKNTIMQCDNEKQQKRIIQKLKKYLYDEKSFLPGTMQFDGTVDYIIVLKNSYHDEMLDLIKKEIFKIDE